MSSEANIASSCDITGEATAESKDESSTEPKYLAIEVSNDEESCSVRYQKEKTDSLKAIFSLLNINKSGFLTPRELELIMRKLRQRDKNIDTGNALAAARGEAKSGHDSCISCEAFLRAILPWLDRDSTSSSLLFLFEGILEEHRRALTSKGLYLDAEKADKLLVELRCQEKRRHERKVVAKKDRDKIKVQLAQNHQYIEFNAKWDMFLKEHDKKSQAYIVETQGRQSEDLEEFRKRIQLERMSQPLKWSRELLEWRKRQHMLARMKNYAEAQKIKAVSDALEDKERRSMNADFAGSSSRKEESFQQQQQAEIEALVKRINVQRREYEQQRALDCKRLRQRNTNVLAVI